MFTEMAGRPYQLKKRAQSRAGTRQRIAAAAALLVQESGPEAVTVSAVATRAGVQRLTVYRHFADEMMLLQAGGDYWRRQNPLPDPARWRHVPDGEERIRTALTALFVYYQGTREFWAGLERRRPDQPGLRQTVAAFRDDLNGIATALAGSGPAAALATLRCAVRFATWRSLDHDGLDDGEKADLVLAWLRGARLE